AHPGYSRKKREALQDDLSGKSLGKPDVKPNIVDAQPGFVCALQDIFTSEPAVLIGLISHLTGSALQDDIAKTARLLQKLGSDILNRPIPNTGGINDQKASHLSSAPAPGAQPVQLGGPPPGT
ncbi:MAG TPA: hypothetical protein PKV86_14270, partial [Syntrophobacteraceae bacterium]|nr:hypothetical protein [Syntrophobacteraceae bacterium]